MELRRAFSISLDKHLWIKDKTNSMKTASHGSVIGPSHANPNCSSDNLNSSMKMRLLRYAKGTIKRLPSTVFTNKWPLSATDLVHVSDSIDPRFLDIAIPLLPNDC